MAGGKHVHAPVKYFCSNKASFLCQLNFMEIIRLSQGWGESGPPQFLGALAGYRTVVFACLSMYVY